MDYSQPLGLFLDNCQHISLSYTQPFHTTIYTSPTKTLHIDDILFIWPHPLDKLNTFLTALNNFHSSLHPIDFLNITVFFSIPTRYRHSKSQKLVPIPIHYNSEHPQSLYKENAYTLRTNKQHAIELLRHHHTFRTTITTTRISETTHKEKKIKTENRKNR